jgi:hypothetical protein
VKPAALMVEWGITDALNVTATKAEGFLARQLSIELQIGVTGFSSDQWKLKLQVHLLTLFSHCLRSRFVCPQ